MRNTLHNSPRGVAAEDVLQEVVVIGAGPAGIAAGVKLRQAGFTDFVILDRADDVGGSWRDNTYPDIGVDVPAIAYQYSFAKNAHWSRIFPKGDEVRAYHVGVARDHGLYDHLVFNTEVVREIWNDRDSAWELHTTDGRVIRGRFVISAVGAFLRPKADPGVPGLESFRGKVQRPTDWDWDYPLTGKRVAVIGNGASSVQITPSIAPEVGHLEVYQRTPVWYLPKPDFVVTPWAQSLLAVPGVQAGLHGTGMLVIDLALRWLTETPAAVAKPSLKVMDRAALAAYRRYVHAQVQDPATADALTPNFGPAVKRPTLTNRFLDTFNRDNVSLVTTSIEAITEHGIRTIDGVVHPLDCLVLATGYDLFSDPESYPPGTIVGRDGFDLGVFFAEHGLQAYESVALPGLPNRWTLVGPYSWSGTGWHAFVELTADHAIRAITHGREKGADRIEVRPEAHERYHARLVRKGRAIQYYYTELHRSVKTYYRNSQGDMAYVRPSSLLEAKWRSRHFPLDDYAYATAEVDTRASEHQETVA